MGKRVLRISVCWVNEDSTGHQSFNAETPLADGGDIDKVVWIGLVNRLIRYTAFDLRKFPSLSCLYPQHHRLCEEVLSDGSRRQYSIYSEYSLGSKGYQSHRKDNPDEKILK